MFSFLLTLWVTAGLHALQSTPSSSLTIAPLKIQPLSPPFLSVPSEGSRILTSAGFGTVALHSSTPSGSNAMDVEIIPSSSASSTSSSSLLRSVDSFGMRLKPWALRAYQKSTRINVKSSDNTNNKKSNSQNRNRAKSILLRIEANSLWMLYIFYRGYRGFFVILPTVVREVYRQLEESDLVLDAYGDDDELRKTKDENLHALTADAERHLSQQKQQQQQQQPIRWGTNITISILSTVLTLSYVFSGALRVLGKFIKTFTNTTSVQSSFEAAAEEMVVNEKKLRNKMR